MKLNHETIVPRLRDGQPGQSIVTIMIAMVALLGAAALVIDIGALYYAFQQLQAATQEAALAGGAVLSNDTASEAIATATSYSAANGDLNAYSNLSNVTITAAVKCLTTTGIICTASPSSANALTVTETATVNSLFARVLGFNTWTLSATATASAKGGYNGPYNVEIILDTTASMGDTDTDSQCSSTRIACALAGIRTLLGTLSPCAAGMTSCGTATSETATVGANVPNPVDEVGMMVFPGLKSTTYVPYDWACPTKSLSGDSIAYNNSPVYQIIALSSNYRTSDTLALNTAAYLTIAAGGGCSAGVSAPGGQGTFYAGVIDAAQANLVANARPNTRNVIILLSDGDATASKTNMGTGATSYPYTQECTQAVTEAQKAAKAGTTVYAVAYGAEASGCTTDVSPSITPCQTMQQIASSPGTIPNPSNFFSDYTATGGTGSCISAARPTSSLTEIFTEIADDLTVARLLPNNTK
ncbi:MAG: pilus assembly protein TadG-related protein [Candidatus Binatus sp.]|uniref:pilus assembly protein TadG-related protein n=1 Tax=Candidatus Binatus sp. TaxID=2811406 RepID=UPI003C78F933